MIGGEVRLTIDRGQGRPDRYGRMLAYVTLPTGADYRLTSITRGRGREYTHNAPYQRQRAYKAAQTKAQDARRGLWRACDPDNR